MGAPRWSPDELTLSLHVTRYGAGDENRTRMASLEGRDMGA
jgi:hypothetical protein